ncbi:hypothetical protein MNV49_007291 [Pseudohyphozyma bogoriensis]|nr:hypothetical protein MNV49_007291 [Pseudohyphozyma bogoriensis]
MEGIVAIPPKRASSPSLTQSSTPNPHAKRMRTALPSNIPGIGDVPVDELTRQSFLTVTNSLLGNIINGNSGVVPVSETDSDAGDEIPSEQGGAEDSMAVEAAPEVVSMEEEVQETSEEEESASTEVVLDGEVPEEDERLTHPQHYLAKAWKLISLARPPRYELVLNPSTNTFGCSVHLFLPPSTTRSFSVQASYPTKKEARESAAKEAIKNDVVALGNHARALAGEEVHGEGDVEMDGGDNPVALVTQAWSKAVKSGKVEWVFEADELNHTNGVTLIIPLSDTNRPTYKSPTTFTSRQDAKNFCARAAIRDGILPKLEQEFRARLKADTGGYITFDSSGGKELKEGDAVETDASIVLARDVKEITGSTKGLLYTPSHVTHDASKTTHGSTLQVKFTTSLSREFVVEPIYRIKKDARAAVAAKALKAGVVEEYRTMKQKGEKIDMGTVDKKGRPVPEPGVVSEEDLHQMDNAFAYLQSCFTSYTGSTSALTFAYEQDPATTNYSCKLTISLAGSSRVYSIGPEHHNKKYARDAVVKLAFSDGVLDWAKKVGFQPPAAGFDYGFRGGRGGRGMGRGGMMGRGGGRGGSFGGRGGYGAGGYDGPQRDFNRPRYFQVDAENPNFTHTGSRNAPPPPPANNYFASSSPSFGPLASRNNYGGNGNGYGPPPPPVANGYTSSNEYSRGSGTTSGYTSHDNSTSSGREQSGRDAMAQGNEAVRYLDDFCMSWMGTGQAPQYEVRQHPNSGLYAAVIRVGLSPNNVKAFWVDHDYRSRAEAEEAVARLAVQNGLLDVVKAEFVHERRAAAPPAYPYTQQQHSPQQPFGQQPHTQSSATSAAPPYLRHAPPSTSPSFDHQTPYGTSSYQQDDFGRGGRHGKPYASYRGHGGEDRQRGYHPYRGNGSGSGRTPLPPQSFPGANVSRGDGGAELGKGGEWNAARPASEATPPTHHGPSNAQLLNEALQQHGAGGSQRSIYGFELDERTNKFGVTLKVPTPTGERTFTTPPIYATKRDAKEAAAAEAMSKNIVAEIKASHVKEWGARVYAAATSPESESSSRDTVVPSHAKSPHHQPQSKPQDSKAAQHLKSTASPPPSPPLADPALPKTTAPGPLHTDSSRVAKAPIHAEHKTPSVSSLVSPTVSGAMSHVSPALTVEKVSMGSVATPQQTPQQDALEAYCRQSGRPRPEFTSTELPSAGPEGASLRIHVVVGELKFELPKPKGKDGKEKLAGRVLAHLVKEDNARKEGPSSQ